MCSCDRDSFGSFRQGRDRCSRCIEHDVSKCFCRVMETDDVNSIVEDDLEDVKFQCAQHGFDIEKFIKENPNPSKSEKYK